MENRSFYNEILTEHNVRPEFKHDLPDADIVLEGVNPSCGDDIFLKLKTDGDTITDGAFVGDGCAISQASADIMLGMIVGKKKEEALQMGKIFMKMIKGDASEEEIDCTQGNFLLCAAAAPDAPVHVLPPKGLSLRQVFPLSDNP
jgi:nitrogen fixation protein NifU and related proteins